MSGSYMGIGSVLGAIVAFLTFAGSWIYCIDAYGFLLGVGLGWLPSGIVAYIVFWATAVLWGPVLALIAVGLFRVLAQ